MCRLFLRTDHLSANIADVGLRHRKNLRLVKLRSYNLPQRIPQYSLQVLSAHRYDNRLHADIGFPCRNDDEASDDFMRIERGFPAHPARTHPTYLSFPT
jgi:hypothetical protein